MSKLDNYLDLHVKKLTNTGRAKGKELIISSVYPGDGEQGTRYMLKGSDCCYIRMNSNSYLGLSLHPGLLKAEEEAAENFGVGPGAVRFISGSYQAHIDLENKLAQFHSRPAAMLFSSAYASSLGVISSLTTNETVIISDELNHNCIINAMKMSRPLMKKIYKHNDINDLKDCLNSQKGKAKRCLVITDGVFSMRGDHAPLAEIKQLCREAENGYEEGVTLIVDDSHGVGAYGQSGRGTEEICGVQADVLIGTLGKAFGVNGGYVTGSSSLIQFLRESSVTYIYSNPITVSEAAAALASVSLVDKTEGKQRIAHLENMIHRFRTGLQDLGYEIIDGLHPVVPLMVRNTEKTAELVDYLRENGVLATGLNYPVVPKGEEEIRFQVCADHTAKDIDLVLEVLKNAKQI